MKKASVSNVRPGNGESGRNAVIYCRVASAEQTELSAELDAQEERCRTYADQRGLRVTQVYKEHASGAATERPVLTDMIASLTQGDPGVVVIIEDMSRLARDICLFFQTRDAIKSAGGVIETLNSPDSSAPDYDHIFGSILEFAAIQARRKAERP